MATHRQMTMTCCCFSLIVITYFLVPFMLKKVLSYKEEHDEFLREIEKKRINAKQDNRVTNNYRYTESSSTTITLRTIATRKTRMRQTRDPYGLLSFNDADV
uniref:Uncharacterized protein n=1 Tax=Clytia hemisphaerica TaxID=252671 RepID=A0A7M6DJM7_9CNID|eukprot:TCONS_00071897-protein